jgi:hypothetical protein
MRSSLFNVVDPSHSFYPISSLDPRIDPRPSSFWQCLDDEDGLQWIPYPGYVQQQRKSDESFAQEMEICLTGTSEIEEADDFSRPTP